MLMNLGCVYQYTPIIPILGRMRQEDGESQASLGYMVRTYLKEKQK
jgi:hypothetical protein